MALSAKQTQAILNGANRVDVIKAGLAAKYPTKMANLANTTSTVANQPSTTNTTPASSTPASSTPTNRYTSQDTQYGGHTTPDGDWVPAAGIQATNPVDALKAVQNQAQPAPTSAPTTSAPVSAPAYDQSAYTQQLQTGVNDIYDKQKQAQLAQLYASRDKAVGQLNQQKAEVAPQYADKRNQSDVVSNQNVQRLREIMANSGLTSSGENVTATVGLQNARQSALNGLNLQEQQTTNDFNRQISDLNNPADENALVAALEAQRSQALYNANIRADDRNYQVGRDAVGDSQWQQGFDQNKAIDSRNFNYQSGQDSIQNAMAQAGLTGKYNGQDTLAAQDAARNFALNQAGVTGKYNGQNTMANNQLIAQLTGQYNGKDTYQAQQDAINNAQNAAQLTGKYNGKDTLAAQQFALQKAQFKSDTDWRKYTYTHMSKQEQVTFDQAKKQYGEDQAWKLYELNYNGEIKKSTNQATIDAYKNAGFNDAKGGSGNFTKKAQGSPTKTFNSQMSQAVQTGGVPSSWVPALTELVGRESTWNSGAKNPKSTAHGYAQFLNSTESKYEKEMGLDYSNPTHQLIMMAKYVQDRYKSPEAALAFWDKNGWY